MKITIDRHIPFIEGAFENVCEVNYLPSYEVNNQSIKNSDALIVRTRTKCDKNLLMGTKVKFIASATTGDDHIDFDFCTKNGINIFVAKGCNASSVAQYIGSAIGFWLKNKNNFKNITIGIVGCGFVGKEVKKLADLLGFNILLNDAPLEKIDKSQKYVSLKTIAENADIITFHTPLTFGGEFATYHLANKKFFDNCKHNPLIINTARGGVIDEKALLKAYHNEQISDFILDCWENEPDISLDCLKNTLLATPHIAGYSADGKANATKMCVDAINNFFLLGLDDFKINLNAKKKILENDSLLQTLLENYDIKNDSDLLKHSPKDFEYFRNHYHERREIDL